MFIPFKFLSLRHLQRFNSNFWLIATKKIVVLSKSLRLKKPMYYYVKTFLRFPKKCIDAFPFYNLQYLWPLTTQKKLVCVNFYLESQKTTHIINHKWKLTRIKALDLHLWSPEFLLNKLWQTMLDYLSWVK